MEQSLERLSAQSPANFRFRGRTASRDYSIVEIVESPEQADPRGRTQSYQAIRRRLGGVASRQPAGAIQQRLFDSLDLGAELEEPAADGPEDDQYGPEEGEG
ncbi:hypothetical protein [Candidatus Poriferisodalis sp.]|uniref:hypothetical protein n=1 Tax=Candidatus Poriferisodalis sp. TaxID=3101277 RepID=UPI003B5A1979